MYRVITETADYLLVDKAPGIALHKDQTEAGLAMQIKADLGLEALMPVHRLDKVTSGLLLFAKNTEAAAMLSGQFARREVEKFYLAISDQKPKRKQGLIIGDMAKARRGSWKLLRSKDNPAITQFFSVSMGSGLRLFLLKPHTGKTHQLRVALKSEGSPILGDPLYHADVAADRTYLHAYSLSFDWQGERVSVCSLPEIGQYFDQACRDLVLQHYAQPGQLDWPQLTRGNRDVRE
ncbi:TIGR01621 family pseudouridine synthase [Neptuniibacter sp. CAU 1671]|uniref:TIGR01621 family pseudouridine synthase n=1 Tax=Neptuniibacter sp. CAU 1671 TaxID=3032593 RepID=UPI0023DC64A7|nr:TIGR01621 family pseudouridine synthase [Neptuniibacter sp. CAU 1671]MDF2183148.1 TIGR01621 family pseudouridine synthase [Neptuniibacter sp. CAU 1671]